MDNNQTSLPSWFCGTTNEWSLFSKKLSEALKQSGKKDIVNSNVVISGATGFSVAAIGTLLAGATAFVPFVGITGFAIGAAFGIYRSINMLTNPEFLSPRDAAVQEIIQEIGVQRLAKIGQYSLHFKKLADDSSLAGEAGAGAEKAHLALMGRNASDDVMAENFKEILESQNKREMDKSSFEEERSAILRMAGIPDDASDPEKAVAIMAAKPDFASRLFKNRSKETPDDDLNINKSSFSGK